MGLNNPVAGFAYAAEFQSSAIPWVTSSVALSGSVTEYDFPMCSRFFTISNLGPAAGVLAFGFTLNGMTDANSNKFYLSGSQVVTLELRVKSLFIMGENTAVPYSLMAGLTTVLAANTPLLTGSQTDLSSGKTVFWPGVG